MMRVMGYTPTELSQVDALREAFSGPLAPKAADWFLGIGDKRFHNTNFDVEGFVGPKGLPNLLSIHNDFPSAYLDASFIDQSVVSTEDVKANVAATLGATLSPLANGSGFDVMKNGQRVGSLTNADIANLRNSLVGAVRSNPNATSIALAGIGTWVGTAPQQVVNVTNLNSAADVVKRADAFGAAMGQAAVLWNNGQPPVRINGESDANFAGRMQTWQTDPSYTDPQGFFSKVAALLRKATSADPTPVTTLAAMQLAGPAHVYGKTTIQIEPTVMQAMIDKGRAAVQQFGAVSVLAQAGATVQNGSIVVTASDSASVDAVQAAVDKLSSTKSQVVQSNGKWTFTNLTFASGDGGKALGSFLSQAKVTNGNLQLPAAMAAADQLKLAKQVLGDPAMIQQGNVMFDNRGYRIVHFADALSLFKGKGNAPQLPTFVPVQDVGAKQFDPKIGIVVRHDGSDSHWNSSNSIDPFGGLEYLHTKDGKSTDLAAAPAAPTGDGWILTA